VPSIYIEDPADPRINGYRDLREKVMRHRDHGFIVEGRGNLRRLIEESSYAPESLLLSHAALEAVSGLIERLPSDVPIYVAEHPVLRDIVGFDFHRGCLAFAGRGPAVELSALLPDAERASCVVALEGLTDADNVGTTFRNAMAFGTDAVLLCPRCCDPLYRKSIRTSMGAALCVPFARAESWPEAPFAALRDAGYTLVAMHPDGVPLGDAATGAATPVLPRRTAMILGAEGEGVSPETLEAVDLRVRIDMAPGFDSINVSAAAAIALHRYFEAHLRAEPSR
jgi:tRNA G18 (ribose-2'-O)-methylase SpoU